MDVASYSMFGLMEILILATGGGVLGLPPGELDPAFVQCAPQESLVFIEWATRGSGKKGAEGIDGFVADPEVIAFLQSIDRAIKSGVERVSDDGNPEQTIVAESLPLIGKIILSRSGCLYISFATPDEGLGESGAEEAQAAQGDWAAALSNIQATIIINAGGQADEFRKKISDLLHLIPDLEETSKLNHQEIPLPVLLPGLKLTIHQHKNYFILGLGKGTIDAAVAGLDSKSQTKSIADNARFNKAAEQIAFERLGSRGWIDVKGIVDNVAKIVGPQVPAIAKMVGADALDSIATSVGVVDGQLASKTFISTGGRTDGILSLVGGRALKPNDLALIPADADFVVAKSFNFPKVLAAAKKIVGMADPNSLQMMEGMISGVEQQLGFSFEDDFFKAFGDVWTVHDSPAAGGVFVTSLVVSLEVRDEKKANDVFTKLMNVLSQSLPPEFGDQFRRRAVILSQKKFMNRTIYYVNAIGDPDNPVAPAFCVTNKQLLFALHPQALKAHLRFLDSDEPNFASRFQRDLKMPQGEAIVLTYFQSKSLVRYIYAIVPYFGQIVLSNIQAYGIDIDIFDLPSARAVLPYTTNSTSSVTRTADGILYQSVGGLPLPGGIGSTIGVMQIIFFAGVRQVRAGVIGVDRPAIEQKAQRADDPDPAAKQKKKKAVKKLAL